MLGDVGEIQGRCRARGRAPDAGEMWGDVGRSMGDVGRCRGDVGEMSGSRPRTVLSLISPISPLYLPYISPHRTVLSLISLVFSAIHCSRLAASA